MSSNSARADVVGCYTVCDKTEFFPARYDELERQAVGYARVIQSFGFAPGSVILTISMVQEVVQFAGFEKGVQVAGHYGINAEASPFDAGRVESISRQFSPVAIAGVGMATIEGLKSLGHDPEAVFSGRTIWARRDAYDFVHALPDCDARRLVLLGPTMALECAQGGLHYPSRDWSLEEQDGTLRLSSRMPRVTAVASLDLKLAGTPLDEPCMCGWRDGVVKLWA